MACKRSWAWTAGFKSTAPPKVLSVRQDRAGPHQRGRRGPMTITGTWRKWFRAVTRAVPASSRIPNDPTAIFNRPHDYDGPFCQQRRALGPCLTQITRHCFYRRLVLGHPDCPTDHVYLTPLEGISIVRVTPKFRWSEIVFAASPVWKGMTADLFKETP